MHSALRASQTFAYQELTGRVIIVMVTAAELVLECASPSNALVGKPSHLPNIRHILQERTIDTQFAEISHVLTRARPVWCSRDRIGVCKGQLRNVGLYLWF